MSEAETEESARPTLWQMITFGCGTEVDQQNNRRFTAWCFAWAVSIIGATWLIETFDLTGALAWSIGLAPNALAFVALIAYLKFLRMTDELQRRIQLEGLAIGFGATWIFGIGYLVLQSAGAPELPLTTMILVMTGGWIFGNYRAVRRYQ